MTEQAAFLLVRPSRRVRGRRWRVIDGACQRQEHYKDFSDCRCRVFADKALALDYVASAGGAQQ